MFAQIKKIDAEATEVVLKAQQEADRINKETVTGKARLAQEFGRKLDEQKKAMQEKAQKETKAALAEIELEHEKRLQGLKDRFAENERVWVNEIFEKIVKR